MDQFEYKVIIKDTDHKLERKSEEYEKELNTLGSQGWELVGFAPQGSWLVLIHIFKRKLP